MSSLVRPETVASELSRLRSLKRRGAITPREAEGFATRAASAFMSHYTATGEGLRDAITTLCEIATLPDETLARAGVIGLFPLIIEPLGDAFDPKGCRGYNRLFAQVIQFCRALPDGEALDRRLAGFGFLSEQDLLDRTERIRGVRRFASQPRAIKKVLVLSRVTIGADVAVTSIVLELMKRLFPRADILFLANEGSRQLFGGDPGIAVRRLSYVRGGGLMGRLSIWLEVVEIIDQEIRGLNPEEYLVVDPDSRLTQLGLLPVLRDESRYHFFESRAYQGPGAETLGQLTGHWLAKVFGGDETLYPYVFPEPADTAWARALTDPLKQAGRDLVSVNLGVGEDQRKRIPDPFEAELIRALIAQGATVILDQGAGEEEVARLSALSERLTALGHRVSRVERPEELTFAGGPPEIITWQGGIGRLSALIAQSHLYIGYDSAGQHIAAAVGVPSIDIFVGYTSPLMPVRWRPYGRGPVSLLTILNGNETDPRLILNEVLHSYRLYRAKFEGRGT